MKLESTYDCVTNRQSICASRFLFFIRFYPPIVFNLCYVEIDSARLSEIYSQTVWQPPDRNSRLEIKTRVVNSDRECRRQSRFIGILTGTTNDS